MASADAKSNAGAKTHRPSMAQRNWIAKGVKALGKIYGPTIKQNDPAPPSGGLTIKGQNGGFIMQHFQGMWLQPDDELKMGADVDGAAAGVTECLVFAPECLYPHIPMPPRPPCGCDRRWVRSDGWMTKDKLSGIKAIF